MVIWASYLVTSDPFHLLTTPCVSLLDALRLRTRSRIPKARWMSSSATLGDGTSSCLRRAWAMRSAICNRSSSWELRKEGAEEERWARLLLPKGAPFEVADGDGEG